MTDLYGKMDKRANDYFRAVSYTLALCQSEKISVFILPHALGKLIKINALTKLMMKLEIQVKSFAAIHLHKTEL